MTYRSNTKPVKGFTIVELMLAMSFLAMLLLAIAMVAIQIGSIYVKGMTLREVNQAGQQISSDMRVKLSQSITAAVATSDETGGRLCVDNTVYAWNYAKSLGNTVGVLNVRSGVTGSESTNVRMMRFERMDGTDYCSMLDNGTYPPLPSAGPTELLGKGNANIALHSFTMNDSTVEGDDSQRVYSITMLVGTRDTGEIGDNDAGACEPSTDIDTDTCAVNRFTFTARSGNKEERQ